jgi:putative chitinase
MTHPDRFFAAVRASLFGGLLTQPQVDGLNALLEGGQTRMLSVPELAYVLATAYHETGRTMEPIQERGGPAYFHRMYDPESPDANRAALAQREGARPGDGVLYFGRGYVQLTWRLNYRKFGALTGLDLEGHPELARQPRAAAQILFEGMRRGMFTGKKLADYIKPGSPPDYLQARRIVNGMDCAADVARYAQSFEAALTQAG